MIRDALRFAAVALVIVAGLALLDSWLGPDPDDEPAMYEVSPPVSTYPHYRRQRATP